MMCKYAVLHSSLPQENKHWPSVDITFNVLCTIGRNNFCNVSFNSFCLVRGCFLNFKTVVLILHLYKLYMLGIWCWIKMSFWLWANIGLWTNICGQIVNVIFMINLRFFLEVQTWLEKTHAFIIQRGSCGHFKGPTKKLYEVYRVLVEMKDVF